MDIDQLYTVDDHASGAEMQVKDIHGNALDMFITLIGCDAKEYTEIKSKLNKALIALSDDDTGEGKLDALAEAVACSSVAWSGFDDKGKALKFSKARIKQLYLSAPYIREQADGFMVSRANFIKGKASK